MPSHFETRTLSYTPVQMFDLVADVGHYKDFVPWCVASRISKWDGSNVFYADLVIGYKMFRERFSSKVMLQRPVPGQVGRIHIEYLEGPLKHLKNQWLFHEEQDGKCRIEFSVEFEFKNLFFQSLVNLFFNEVVKRMVGAFETRAKTLYGDPGH